MFDALKTIAAELKRANDLKEKELDLKILGPNDFEKKMGSVCNVASFILFSSNCNSFIREW